MALLLTSFAPWKAHQTTNASDDLLALLQAQSQLPSSTIVLRQLPVHFQLAPCQVLSALLKHRPATVVCCGMAERRSLLNLERYAHRQGDRLETALDLHHLSHGTQWTRISHDAGTYVCNDLYYHLLAHVQKHRLPTRCLFVHVPRLHPYNQAPIAEEFALILSRLQAASHVADRTAA